MISIYFSMVIHNPILFIIYKKLLLYNINLYLIKYILIFNKLYCTFIITNLKELTKNQLINS